MVGTVVVVVVEELVELGGAFLFAGERWTVALAISMPSSSSEAAMRAGPHFFALLSATTRSTRPSRVAAGLSFGRDDRSSSPSGPNSRNLPYHFDMQRREIPASAAT